MCTCAFRGDSIIRRFKAIISSPALDSIGIIIVVTRRESREDEFLKDLSEKMNGFACLKHIGSLTARKYSSIY